MIDHEEYEIEDTEEISYSNDLSISHPFMTEFREAINAALVEAVSQAEMNNEVSVAANIKFQMINAGRDGVKAFMPAEHKVTIKVKRESLQMTGISHAFVANRIDGRIILTDPDEAQMTIGDLMT